MNSPIDKQLYDEHDLLIRQALDEVSVPPDAKVRARQRLALAAMESVADSSTAMVASAVASNSTGQGQLTSPLIYSRPIVFRLQQAGNWLVDHRRLASSLALSACVLFSVGIYLLTRPLDRSQLVAVCSEFLDQRLEPQPDWAATQSDDLREWLRTLRLNPRSISQVTLPEVPLGTSGQLWKLGFEGREDLYVLELRGAASIQGVGKRVEILQASSNRWSLAARQEDQYLLVFMTKGNLEQFLQLVPLA
jgi:hypothetical protein